MQQYAIYEMCNATLIRLPQIGTEKSSNGGKSTFNCRIKRLHFFYKYYDASDTYQIQFIHMYMITIDIYLIYLK